MTQSGKARLAAIGDACLRVLPLVSMLGFAGLVMSVVIGFEEPDQMLLVLSALAMLVPLFGPFLHLAFTVELTPEEKRAWLRELVGHRAAWAWSNYLTCTDRRKAARRLGEQEERKRLPR